MATYNTSLLAQRLLIIWTCIVFDTIGRFREKLSGDMSN